MLKYKKEINYFIASQITILEREIAGKPMSFRDKKVGDLQEVITDFVDGYLPKGITRPAVRVTIVDGVIGAQIGPFGAPMQGKVRNNDISLQESPPIHDQGRKDRP